MAATLGLTNMSKSSPNYSLFPSQNNSEFSHYEQKIHTDGTDQFLGFEEPSYEFMSSADVAEKQESTMISGRNEAKCSKDEIQCSRIGFRTKSEIDILDDGFKWRKYGKKAVKNSPNPRNYYRCTNEGCHVKKRVERDKHDPIYVITTYEGVHNHFCPGTVLYQNYH
ncbi:hypothetical protein LUZ60_009596 [Juncus effusus]|nr:hypothetical protein LUZ60_009596 [Juncus effusus]